MEIFCMKECKSKFPHNMLSLTLLEDITVKFNLCFPYIRPQAFLNHCIFQNRQLRGYILTTMIILAYTWSLNQLIRLKVLNQISVHFQIDTGIETGAVKNVLE